ncbi:hypothetical protein [Mycobacterium sp. ZZG]
MGDTWSSALLRRLGELIASDRKEKGVSAVKLAEATAQLGAPIHRAAIPRIEKGEQAVTVPELLALGIALDSDASWWLIRAAEGLDVTGERDEHIDWRATLVEVMDQIITLEQQLRQLDSGLENLRMPQSVREHRQADRQRYIQMIESLQEQRETLLELLETPEPDESRMPSHRKMESK